MTKEEAITFLKCDRERTCYDFIIGHCDGCNVRTALDMAIKALKSEPVKHGHWLFNGKPIEKWSHGNYCSVCGEYSETCGNYCPYCGAEMDDVEDE